MKSKHSFLFVSVLIIGLLLPSTGISQEPAGDICRIGDGRIEFRLNLNWSREELLAVSQRFDLDTVLLQQAIAGRLDTVMQGDGWKLLFPDPLTVQLFCRLDAPRHSQSDPAPPQPPSRLFLLDDDWLHQPEPPATVAIGVNDFKDSLFRYTDGMARFFLAGHTNARRVILSGTFNQWSTSRLSMLKEPDGWSLAIPLTPGRYEYKFIIDGRWTPDPNNRLRTDDWNGGYNSVLFCYNYRFSLKGHPDARKVVLAGSFNGFNPSELRMHPTAGGWELPVYLRPGTHAYKFIVDGTWITDPGNPTVRPDGFGNLNSFVGLGDTTWFRLRGYQNAASVVLTGSFNGWNTAELAMEKTEGGWQVPYILAPGNYEYKFIADGQWILDPENPHTTGEGKYTNSFLAVNPNQTFVLKKHPDARTVLLTGCFNNWNPNGYRMARINGQWVLNLHLDAGKYTYKFIVDGQWITDPDNDLWEENEFGTGNSVIWK